MGLIFFIFLSDLIFFSTLSYFSDLRLKISITLYITILNCYTLVMDYINAVTVTIHMIMCHMEHHRKS